MNTQVSNHTLSNRVTQVKPSATMALNAKASELKAQGKDVINLTVGEPDFDTPDFVKQAAIDAINNNKTRYTAADGIPELKQAIINKLKKDNNLSYEPNQVIATSGAKQALFNLAQVVLNDGDEAIIPAPYWVSYPAIVQLAGGTPVIIGTDIKQNFKISPEQLQQAITSKTRLLFLNSPSNPSGMAYTADELKALGDVLKKHPNIIIASDDIYEYILWGMDKYVSILNVCPELTDQTVIINGVSKAHAMTGWRLGYAAGPANIIGGMKKIQSQSTSCCSSITQYAAVAALNADRSFFTPMLNAYKERHDMMLAGLNSIDGIECSTSDGTFYLYPNIEGVMQRYGIENDVAFADLVLGKANVATVPGTAFGTPGYIRISCATSMENLESALSRLKDLFKD